MTRRPHAPAREKGPGVRRPPRCRRAIAAFPGAQVPAATGGVGPRPPGATRRVLDPVQAVGFTGVRAGRRSSAGLECSMHGVVDGQTGRETKAAAALTLGEYEQSSRPHGHGHGTHGPGGLAIDRLPPACGVSQCDDAAAAAQKRFHTLRFLVFFFFFLAHHHTSGHRTLIDSCA